MGRTDLPKDSIHEVGALFETALREVAAELSVATLDGIERRLQPVGRAVLGQVVEQRLRCPPCDGSMRRVDLARTRHIQGVVSDYQDGLQGRIRCSKHNIRVDRVGER